MTASLAESFWKGPPKNFADLLKEVYDRETCTYCLVCMDACAQEGCDAVTLEGNAFKYTPTECLGSGICYVSCPEVESLDRGLETLYGTDESEIGHVEIATSVMTSDWSVRSKVHEGGAVPSLIKYLLENKLVDAAVMPAPGGISPSGLLLVDEAEEAVTPTGYKFKKPTTTRFLRDLYRSHEKPLRLALVANPCQARMVRKMQLNNVPPSRDVKLIIGEFCYATLSNAKWRRSYFENALGAGTRLLRSVEVKDRVKATFHDGTESTIDLDDVHLAFDSSCLSCTDYSNALADISVGPEGSPEGFETVLARTDEGVQALQGALEGGYLAEWSSLFKREDHEGFRQNLLDSVTDRVRSKVQLATRRGRPSG